VKIVSMEFRRDELRCTVQVVKADEVSRRLGVAHDMLSRLETVMTPDDRLLDATGAEDRRRSESASKGENVAELHIDSEVEN
jgi:hypothetical protein